MAKKRPYWMCKSCGARLERTRRKCDCGKARPKPRIAAHKRTLQNDDYARYCEVAAAIHGVTDESCCSCRKPRSQERHHDRDHDHKTGDPRGLLCHRCNRALVSWATSEWLRGLADYKDRADQFYRSASGQAPAGRDKPLKAAG